jgi:4-hydroxy-3-polyprenylbenzoate decarboxylase
MTFKNLGEFLARIERDGDLVRVKDEVSPILEVAEIADRMSKSPGGGKALLFEKVAGSKYPLAINALGSFKRMATALGVTRIDEIGERIEAVLRMKPPATFAEKLRMLPTLLEFAKYPPVTVGRGACQEVVAEGGDVNVLEFPVIQCWPNDAGRFITMGLVFTADPRSGNRNVGLYRMQVYDGRTTAMHWHIHKDGAHHFHEYKKLGKRMDVSAAIGTDPVVTYAASAPLPREVDELLFAGFIRRAPVEIVKCRTNDLFVPAEAEIVLEGYVDPAEEMRIEGPFGDHTGYYSPADKYPVFHITAITHRKNPVYMTTIVGRPPMEDCYMGKATERIFLPLIKAQIPEVVDINMPFEGVFHNCVIVSIRKEFPMQAHKVMHALWGMGQMSFAKLIVVVDGDVNVQDASEVTWRAFNNVDARRDLVVSEGPLDVLDHSAAQPLFGAKLGVDATRKLAGEGYAREWPEDIVMSADVKAKVQTLWEKIKESP